MGLDGAVVAVEAVNQAGAPGGAKSERESNKEPGVVVVVEVVMDHG